MSQRANRQRIREISSQITELSRELERLLSIEETNNVHTDRAPAIREIEIGDHVEITNSYIGRFGATRGSRGVVTSIQRSTVFLRLDSNGAAVSRGRRNLILVEQPREVAVERQREKDGAAQ